MRRMFDALELRVPDGEVGVVADGLQLRYSRSASVDDRFELRTGRLEVTAGRVTCLFGTNGSGKSTLLRALAGFHSNQSGAVQWLAANGSPEVGVDFVLVAENSPWPHMTILENVALPLNRVRGWPKEKATNTARRVLDCLGLGCMHTAHPHELSAGQQQRAVLARGLVLGTPALLLDEILSAQSEAWAKRIARLLNVLVADYGRMVFMVCHDPDWVELHADQVVQLASTNGSGDDQELLSEQVFTISYSGGIAGWLESRKELARRIQATNEAKTTID